MSCKKHTVKLLNKWHWGCCKFYSNVLTKPAARFLLKFRVFLTVLNTVINDTGADTCSWCCRHYSHTLRWRLPATTTGYTLYYRHSAWMPTRATLSVCQSNQVKRQHTCRWIYSNKISAENLRLGLQVFVFLLQIFAPTVKARISHLMLIKMFLHLVFWWCIQVRNQGTVLCAKVKVSIIVHLFGIRSMSDFCGIEESKF